ncbi:MAG TPA: class I SAM-dependent methyltransferase [Polyangiaceae bacterium]|nr:class I SAM-dependent methyltransferase [Polyangiaceae bacterium]
MSATESAVLGAHLEHPDALPRQRAFPLQGWVTSRAPLRAAIVEGPEPETLTLRLRPDVVKALPDAPYASGYFGVAKRSHVRDGKLALRFVFDDGSASVEFAPPPEGEDALRERTARLRRVYPLLRCIRCESGFPGSGYAFGAETIRCAECGAAYDCSQGMFDLLPDETRAALTLDNDGNISHNDYDPATLAFVNEDPNALILDCGAGLRRVEHPNVVNLETVPYRSTDVLADNERLPFRDGAFDGVLSLAVLEHVRDPLLAAREIGRVLKPGGRLLAVVPLLAPVHAFPHHYFNMTAEGLARLFADQLEVVEQSVPESGLPVWALTWMLRSWAEGLPEAPRESFMNLRVRDLLAEGHEYLGRDFVRTLPREKNFELAATTLLLGKKRG